MYRLKGWYIVGNIAYGNVSGNPKFPNGYFIHTSKIHNIKIDEPNWEVVITTKNSVYHCSLDSCKFDDFIYNVMDEDAVKIRKYKDIVQKKYMESIPLNEDVAIIEFDDFQYNVSKYMICDNGQLFLGEEPSVHLGMIQDSVLLDFNFRKDIEVDFDIRFFPYNNNTIEFYSWVTDRDVILKNVGDYDLTIRESLIHNIPMGTGTIVLKPGESRRFNKDGALVV